MVKHVAGLMSGCDRESNASNESVPICATDSHFLGFRRRFRTDGKAYQGLVGACLTADC